MLSKKFMKLKINLKNGKLEILINNNIERSTIINIAADVAQPLVPNDENIEFPNISCCSSYITVH